MVGLPVLVIIDVYKLLYCMYLGNKIDRALAFFICAETYLMENSEKCLSPASLLQQSGYYNLIILR